MHTRTLALVCALLFAWPVSAQEQRGSIEGVIKDSTGAVMPGVTVEARSPSLVGTATAATNAEGIYRFPALTPGRYEITAALQGFTSAKVQNVSLELGQILKVDLTLATGGITETVQVTGESPLIDVKQNAAAATVQREVLERLPQGRNRDFLEAVAWTAPGAQAEYAATREGWLQIDGSSGSENRFIVDGMDTTSTRTGVSQKEVLADFVQEIQVKSSGYNAEHRGATGGTISAITKSGSNRWRGGMGFYFDSNRLRGDVRPSLRLNPSDQTIAEYITTPRDDFRVSEPVFELGGPILRDRVWFFAGYIPQIEKRKRTVTFRSNGQTGTFEDDETDHNVNYNVTGQISKNLRGRFAVSNERFLDETSSLPGIEADRTSLSNPTLFPSPLASNTFNDSYIGVVDYVATNRLYFNVTSGYLTYGTRGRGAGDRLRHSFGASNLQFPEIPPELRNVNGFTDFASSSRTVFDDYGRYTLNADASYYGSRWGQHTLKAGVQYERIVNDVLSGAQHPTITLNWNLSRSTLDGRNVRGPYGFYTVTETKTIGEIGTNNLGFFVQDSWTISDRLTLNLGVRADREDIPSYNPDNSGIHFAFGDKISPRAGFAWDMTGDSRWKMYGSWGKFFDISKLEMPRGLFGADRSITYYYTLDTFNWPAIQCSHPPVSGPNCPGTFIEQVDFRHPANSRDNFLIDPNLKPIQTQEFTLGLDHELNRTMSLGVRYIHKWFVRTFEDTGVLVPGVGEVYRITNVGEGIGENVLRDFTGCTTCPNQPKPKRNYDALELRLRKRFADRWSMITSYTWSRLYGNYSGLSSTDEAGRTSPSVNRFFDGQYNSFSAEGQPVFGRLQTDRPHVYKLSATYDFPWGTSIGSNYIVESGTPLQTQMSWKGIPFFPFGRGNLGRTPTFQEIDIQLQHDFRLPGGRRVNVNMNVDNLFDQDTVTGINQTRYRGGNFNASDQVFFAGFDPVALAAASPAILLDNRFRQPNGFQAGRVIRFGTKFTF